MEKKDSITIRKTVINQAINYIFEHLDENLTVEDVAEYCSYSKYHLTRMFKEDTDEALYQFIKRVRLERSAWRLKVEKQRSITKIGEAYGYSSSNFATAFKKQLPEEWCHFIEKYKDLATKDTLYLECTIDDPSITDEDSCMYELCQTIIPDHPKLKDHPEIMIHDFEGGKYAVYHFYGIPQLLFMVYQEIFCRWLSRTGNELDERPIIDIYRMVKENGYMEIDICFPLKSCE